ncbi:MAG: M20/M25/M40 family metallo-hydrolase [Pseudomonadota bacterium]
MTATPPKTDTAAARWGLLRKLVMAPGVPGREGPVRDVIQAQCEAISVFDEIRVDPLGTLICRRAPRSGPDHSGAQAKRVLVAAHMDQIGFLVSFVEDGGFLRLHPMGAFDPRTLFARNVRVVNESGQVLPGVIHAEGRALHHAPEKDRQVVPELDSFFVDLSLPEDEVRALVEPGDMVVLAGGFDEVGTSIVAPCLDDRAGCWALLAAMERLDRHTCEVVAAFTAQEEVGSRGALPLAFAVEADLGIACDTTVCDALPGNAPRHHVTVPGAGVAIQIADASMISDHRLVGQIETVAKARGIPFQRSLLMGGGQDGARIHTARQGVPTVVLSCPIKYIHTATEMARVEDLHAFRDLLAAVLESVR